MDACDVLIFGAGPAGSSCAWKLRRSGINVALLDRDTFPRNKVCGGWITLPVLAELEIAPAAYAPGRTLQPITGFKTSVIGEREIENDYGHTISYGIRRYEFDDYLLKRSEARVIQGATLASLERSGENWIVNEQIRARLIVGAGGHFCPVARFMGTKATGESVVAAQEAEFEMTPEQRDNCSIRPEIPELFFCSDLKGYGWCFRKNDYLNVGLGRLDRHSLGSHMHAFIDFLRRSGKVTFDLPSKLFGHAYLLYGRTTREIVADSMLLIGDAAGMAYAQSGEGIRPAVESGLLAAKAILAAKGDYSRESLEPYRAMLTTRFGSLKPDWPTRIGSHLPAQLISTLGRALLATNWFSRSIVLDSWFLRTNEPAFNPN
jgi:geranylgeranyl reductase family protein